MVTYDARPSQFTPLTTQFEWEKLFSAMGIFDGIDGSTDFAPSSPSGGSISVAAGTVIVKGQMWRCDAPQPTALPANPASGMLRTDILWVQYNRAASGSTAVVQLIITSGAPVASNPAAPPPVQNPVGTGGAGVWQIPVAQWTVNNAGTISGFTDIRQFSGKSTILMFSTARPTPAQPRLGLEIDTGNLMRWSSTTGWVTVVPVAPPKVQTWHWTYSGAVPAIASSVLPGSAQSITIAANSQLIVNANCDIATPAAVNTIYTFFMQLNGSDIEGNSFIVLECPSFRATLSRDWVVNPITPGTYTIQAVHNVNNVAQACQNRGGDITVTAIPL